MTTDLWQRGCERLAAELPEPQFNTWIRPLSPTAVANNANVMAVQVPNRFKLDWIRSQYAGRIESALTAVAGCPVRLELSLAPRTDPHGSTLRPADGSSGVASAASLALLALGEGTERQGGNARHSMGQGNVVESGVDSGVQSSINRRVGNGSHNATGLAMPAGATPSPTHRLNTALTFDTLVAGRANQMARTAALHVAGAPGLTYNPLFIYGGVGLGKTHLVHAVGNALLHDRPQARVLYLHAEQFISDVVKNYQRKTFDELKAKYHSLDLLLIDDVQFFAGKERTQEEFFNAFEALLTKRAHIIMTSDTYPKGLVDIDERLTSRFEAGLTVAIEPPELEMRVAILMRKAELEATTMPEDVAFFVAKNVR
ncbi:MAG: chromosomal replication initiator protein DnaA, partial [Pseudomonadota bacterium]|nr:chromosomal replication initiator protein DnaA [Pseudomonadota bacterium]